MVVVKHEGLVMVVVVAGGGGRVSPLLASLSLVSLSMVGHSPEYEQKFVSRIK